MLRKYQEYYKTKESRHDIFKIQQLEDDSLEDYLERFIYTLHKSKYNDLQEDAVRTLFFKGISEDLLESLNLMAASDISHKNFAQICEMCKNYSRSRRKVVKIFREPFSRNVRGNVPSSGGVTRVELGNMLETFKTDILGEMGSRLDDLQAKKRQDEEREAMSIFVRDVELDIPKGNVH